MKKRTELLMYIILLGIVDIVIPVPILAILIIYGILARPVWFLEIIQHIHDDDDS